jgi:hypothetical protein
VALIFLSEGMNTTLEQYNKLATHYRVLLLEQASVYIACFLTLEVTATLYYYNGYYIELIVDNTSNDLIDVLAFDDPAILEKYVEDLVLDDLLQAN